MKRIAAVVFVSLAGIMMLAHAVIPHHHHYSEICFQKSHCENEQSNENENNPAHHHENTGEDSHDGCALNAPVLLPAGLDNNECKCISFIYRQAGAMFFAAEILNSDQKIFIPSKIQDDSSPGIIMSNKLLVYSSSGLRAPPVV